MEIDLSEYMGAYIDGARENLDMMDKKLLELEQNPSNIEAVGEIFRAAHTLKGMSATMGFEKIAHLTHEMENLLDKLRNNQLAVTPPVIDLIFETFDILRTLVEDSINQTESTVDLSEISGKLSAMANGQVPAAAAPAAVQAPPPASNVSRNPAAAASASNANISEFGLSDLELSGLHEAKDSGKHVILLKVSLVADCLLKGPRVFMVMRAIEECQAEITKSLPDVKDLENEKFDRSFKMLLISAQSSQDVKGAIEGISEIESVETTELSAADFSEGPTPAPISAPQPVYAPPAPSAPPAAAAPPPPPQPVAVAPTPQPVYAPQAATPVSVPKAPAQPAIAQPTPPPPQAVQQQAAEESE
ncbi:MAG: Hpt domain-containing protein, partial [Candidatus Riflebacteria bacterium]|nr:Hpt domain-containing protein [Candidatus Riflebacteria bacterium]